MQDFVHSKGVPFWYVLYPPMLNPEWGWGRGDNVVVCHAYLEPVQDFVHQLSLDQLSKGVSMSTCATDLSTAHGVGAGPDSDTNVVVRHAYLEPVSMGRARVLLCAMCTLNLRKIVPINCPIDRLFKGVSICTHATHLFTAPDRGGHRHACVHCI